MAIKVAVYGLSERLLVFADLFLDQMKRSTVPIEASAVSVGLSIDPFEAFTRSKIGPKRAKSGTLWRNKTGSEADLQADVAAVARGGAEAVAELEGVIEPQAQVAADAEAEA